MSQKTVTNRPERDRRLPRQAPHLVILLDYERPLAAGSRHELDGLDHVDLGRAASPTWSRNGKTLSLGIADTRMSQRHAQLVRDLVGWSVVDQSSRNGTWVDGVKVEHARLTDGALIELGRTALLFRVGEVADVADRDAAEVPAPLPGIRTFSASFARKLGAARKLARSGQCLVLHGETGTGKEVIARAIHSASGRAGPFIAVNCGALPPNLIESELFGSKKGAFSGALEDRPGLVRAAHGGTLFLDEVGDMPAPSQAALLRVLQEREVMPIGGTRPIAVDVRVLAASHRDLEAEVEAGRFREDLLARLAGHVIEVPALRHRREDLGILIAALMARAGADKLRLMPDAAAALLRHDWPRNVRELEQALATAIALADDGVITLEYLPPTLRQAAITTTEAADADDLAPSELRRRDELRTLLATHRGNVAAVARALGVARMQIHRWLERYAIDIDDFRKPT